MVPHEPLIHDSKLDSDLSVAILEFTTTPRWFKSLEPYGFPRRTELGTLWRGVDLTNLDDDHRNEFTRAVIAGDLVYAETLAEFPATDVNSQDSQGRTALHWACAMQLTEMTQFCLTVPEMNTALKDREGLTAFDISCGIEGDAGELVQVMFYDSMFEIQKRDPDRALLRLLTISSEPDDEGPVFPGEALFGPVIRDNIPLVKALMETGVDLTATNEMQETALHLAAKLGNADMVNTLVVNASRGERFQIEAVAEDGRTALQYAEQHGFQDVVQVLRDVGADMVGNDQLAGAVESHTADQENHEPKTNSTEDRQFETNSTENTQFDEALHRAAENGHSELVQKLLDHGANIEARGKYWRTVLVSAANEGRLETVKILLDRGAAIDAKNIDGRTALHHAAMRGHINIVHLLLDQGANIEASDKNGVPALHEAGIHGLPDIVETLLDRGARIDAKDIDGDMALHMAAVWNQPQILEILLKRGADIEAGGFQDTTPLHRAVGEGRVDSVRVLLDNGADIEARGNDMETPLHSVVQGWKNRPLQCIPSRPYIEQDKVDSVPENLTVAMQELLDRGANIEAKTQLGLTAFNLATIRGDQKLLQVLLKRGANSEARDDNGVTLHVAAMHNRWDIIRKLLDQGANLEARGSEGETILYTAAMYNRLEMIQELLILGADRKAKTSTGKTAIDLAKMSGDTELIRLLNERRLPISLKNAGKRAQV